MLKQQNKIIFLDRDGTINKDTHYLHRIDDFSFLPGAVDALAMFQTAGFKLIIITNQSGIARGLYTESEYILLNKWMIEELNKHGIEITASYYCPHHPDAVVEKYRIKCDCRKPKIGLFKKAMTSCDIDEANSWVIGDNMRDLAICAASSVRGILLYSEQNEHRNNIWKVKGGLKDAAEKVINGYFK